MSCQRYFSTDYTSARALLLLSCRAAGLTVENHQHPLQGPAGEPLFSDTILIGRADAPRLLVLISGTHGVETLCGSACQTGFIAEEQWKTFADDTAVLLIHAVNCWGAAHLRRNNEDNVDLNRNFVNFDEPRPVNLAYEEIHNAIACPQHEGPLREEANAILSDFRAKNGIQQFVAAIMGGQYLHSDGMAFGGGARVWSSTLLTNVLSRFRTTAERVSIVEYHSGLGPYGYGSAVCMQTGSELTRVRAAYGHWLQTPNEPVPGQDEPYFKATGHTTDGFREAFNNAELSAIVLEYGTYPPMASLPVMMEDHWLVHYGDVGSAEGQKIKSRLLELHYPNDPDWRQAVWDRSVQVIEQARRALA